ncbi:MAG: AAA family ATPase [Bacteroidetes bacterium]|jgi:exodeoxyribonuclease-5|nr:AAA family ATPase [Bacteroidota bacterium]
MLHNHIADKIRSNLPWKPTSGQDSFIDQLSAFYLRENEMELMILRGYAGTGKTSLIGALVKAFGELRQKTMLMAPTGRAAKVLSAYTLKTAFTIHKKIYRQKSSTDGMGRFVLEKNLHTNTLFIVDESSMISNQMSNNSVFGSGNLLDDLVEYIYSGKNCKLLLTGDTAQLPPVGLDESPSLLRTVMEVYGLKVIEYELTEVMRQAETSELLTNATYLRNCIRKEAFPLAFLKEGNKEIVRINGVDLVDEITRAYDLDGIKETIVISRSNKRANKYNEGIRNQVLFRDDELCAGDQLMVVKNNYHWLQDEEKIDFIANGDIVEVQRIGKYHQLYGFKFVDVTVSFPDYDDMELETKLLLDTLYTETPALSSDENKNLFYAVLEDYTDIKGKRNQYNKVKEDPYFNALQVKFAYAITCHKAQGGQWKNVFVDQGYLTEDRLDKSYFRWLYTALTRSTDKVYLVNFADKFFYQ